MNVPACRAAAAGCVAGDIDEASYSRFLRRERMESSPQAYSAFWREREADRPPSTMLLNLTSRPHRVIIRAREL